MLFDTHLHLVDRARLSYPWLAGVPALQRDWTLPDYATAAARLGITAALHMEVDVAPADIEAETAMVARHMRDAGGLLRGAISAARPEEAGFPAWLDRQDRAVVRGIRRVLHVVPDAVSQGATFRANVARLGAAGLPFDICMTARQLPLAAALVDACPGTTFILDHCGNPDIASGAFAPWEAALRDLARRPNLNAKISGITANTVGRWTLATLRPCIETVIDAFGWDRVVWGSDSPVCTLHSSLDQWVAVTLAVTSACAPSEKARLYRENARRIWAIPDPVPDALPKGGTRA